LEVRARRLWSRPIWRNVGVDQSPSGCGHPSLPDQIQGADRALALTPPGLAGGPPVSAASVLRVQVQELTPGLVDAVAVTRRGQRAVFIAMRLEAVPDGWELIELLY
jgi:Family of unknown function (DUF6459)